MGCFSQFDGLEDFFRSHFVGTVSFRLNLIVKQGLGIKPIVFICLVDHSKGLKLNNLLFALSYSLFAYLS